MPQTVLLIHPQVDKAKLVKRSLLDPTHGDFTVEWVESRANAMRRLRKNKIKRIAAVLMS